MSSRDRDRTSGSPAIWILIAVVSVGVLLGAGAFYYFAVLLPWQKEVSQLQRQESDLAYEIGTVLDPVSASAFSELPDDYRNVYQSFADSMESTHQRLRHLGVEPRYPIPPFKSPPKKQ